MKQSMLITVVFLSAAKQGRKIGMSTTEVPSKDATNNASVATLDTKLEIIIIPVSDIDRAKEFYSRLGWRLDAD